MAFDPEFRDGERRPEIDEDQSLGSTQGPEQRHQRDRHGKIGQSEQQLVHPDFGPRVHAEPPDHAEVVQVDQLDDRTVDGWLGLARDARPGDIA